MMKGNKRLILALVLLLLLTLAGCGGAPDRSTDAAEPNTAYNEGVTWDMAEDESADRYSTTASEESMGLSGSGESNLLSGLDVYNYENSKLIRTATMTIETLEFDEAVATLNFLVTSCGGYYGSSDVWSSGRDEYAIRTGDYVVRIPQNYYNQFMNGIGDVGTVTRRSESAQDVGEEYYNTELRLETLHTKHDRLLALLAQATDMESIITLQNYLADVEYEIDLYSGTLRRYDSLVNHATINISLQEKTKLTAEPGEKATFGEQIGSAFGESLHNFGAGVQSFMVWAAYHFVGLLCFAVIVLIACVVGRKQWKKRGSVLFTKEKTNLSAREAEKKEDGPSDQQ